MASSLPPVKTILNELLNSLASLPSQQVPSQEAQPINHQDSGINPPFNPLKDAAPAVKSLLLTLHVIYPHELLPALDLLDRRLLSRLSVQLDDQTLKASGGDNQTSGPSTQLAIYSVRSAQNHSSSSSSLSSRRPTAGSRFHDSLGEATKRYEVRLQAWNCSCPAFAFAAFPAGEGGGLESLDADPDDGDAVISADADQRYRDVLSGGDVMFGGLRIRPGAEKVPPLCKHLLACMLAEGCPVFRPCVEERIVSVEELAGWCAGFGE